MIAFVYGTRPEAIKIGPVVAETRESVVYCTGQHTSLLDNSPAANDLVGAIDLEMPSDGKVTTYMMKAITRLEEVFRRDAPQLVVVQGDTMSAYAGMAAADRVGIAVAHIEAGVRSGNRKDPYPEEGFRISIDEAAALHFAPTEHCALNLIREGIRPNTIKVTGNTVVSAMQRYAPDITPLAQPVPQIVVTLHRRELREDGVQCRKILKRLVEAFGEAEDFDFLWPVHPAMESFVPKIVPGNVRLHVPWNYDRMLQTLSSATALLTDSGGLVEEACTLGIPTLIFRRCNDRPEAIMHGTAAQVAPTPEGAHLAVQILTKEELRPRRAPSFIYGTDRSAVAVANALMEAVDDSTGYREERDQADHGVDR